MSLGRPNNIVARDTPDMSSSRINVGTSGVSGMVSSTISPTEQPSVVATAATSVGHEMNLIASFLDRQQKQDLQHSLSLAKNDVNDLMERYVSVFAFLVISQQRRKM